MRRGGYAAVEPRAARPGALERRHPAPDAAHGVGAGRVHLLVPRRRTAATRSPGRAAPARSGGRSRSSTSTRTTSGRRVREVLRRPRRRDHRRGLGHRAGAGRRPGRARRAARPLGRRRPTGWPRPSTWSRPPACGRYAATSSTWRPPRRWTRGPSDVVGQFGRVNVLVNNAGVSLTGEFADLDAADMEWIVGINFWGVVNGTRAFLPHLIASGDGHVVTMSSLFGLVSIPGQTIYNATKYAVRGFSESLREEMLMAGHPVGVTVVHPGGIKTAIARSARVWREDQRDLRPDVRRAAGQDVAGAGRRDHPARRAAREAARAGRPRRPPAAPVRPHRRRPLPGRRRPPRRPDARP